MPCYTLPTDSVARDKFNVKITTYVSGSGSQCRIGMDDVSSYLTEPKLLHTYIMHAHCYLSMETRALIKYVDIIITTVHQRSVCT